MSLDWSIERIKNFQALCWIPDGDGTASLNATTNSLIWATMSVGINEITEKNYNEFYLRFKIFAKTRDSGAVLWGAVEGEQEQGKHEINLIDIYQHIGLSTNASSKSRTQFMKDLFLTMERDYWAEHEALDRYKESLRQAEQHKVPFIDFLTEPHVAWTQIPHSLGTVKRLIKEHPAKKAELEQQKQTN